MTYFIIIAILLAVLAVLYVWYITRGLNSIDDNAFIPLETDEDKLLVHWYKANIHPIYDFNINDVEIATKYLQRIYNIEIDPGLLIVGNNLSSHYHELTRKSLSNKYDPNIDCIFDLRSSLAMTGEIAIVHDEHIRRKLQSKSKVDFTDIGIIMNNDLDGIAHEYITNVLKFRWDKIKEMNDPNVLNERGSYLYYRLQNHEQQGPTTILDKITALVIPIENGSIARINLLCSNYEFEALIYRWKHLNSATFLNGV